MNPQMLMILQLLGPLAGAFFKDRSTEKLLKMAGEQSSPEALLRKAHQFYNEYLSSPAFSHGQRDILASANKASSAAAASLASRGLLGSGPGILSSSVSGSLSGFGMAGLRSKGWEDSLNHAVQSAQLTLSGAGSLPGQRNIGQDSFAAFLDAFGKLKPTAKKATTTGTTGSNIDFSQINSDMIGAGMPYADYFGNLKGRQ